ncbi:MAG: LysM peptidoglycan-binding domain-containing protein [Planctomycetota bacterium]|jgi:hypothetical protein
MLGLLRIAVLLAAGLVLGHALVQPETFGQLFEQLGTRIEDELEAATAPVARAPLGEDWATVLIGAPSGAEWLPPSAPVAEDWIEPVAPPQRPPAHSPGPEAGPIEVPFTPPGQGSAPPTFEPEPEPIAPQPLPDFTLEIQSGMTLSQIAVDHYGTYRSGVLEALVRYNGLKNANDIRIGQSIALPDREKLMAQ